MKQTLQGLYSLLFEYYGSQGWWPIINDKTLLCEYHTGAPKNKEEQFEIIIGCILAQNTQWYPNVVRSLQQLKAGRIFTKNELEVIREAETQYAEILKCQKKQTKSNILTQNTAWSNVEKALENLRKNKCLSQKAILQTKQESIAHAIKSAGYFNQKAERLKIIAAFLLQHPLEELQAMETGELRKLLLSVKGIGPETADSIILYAFNKSSFVIDVYTKRILSRMGFCRKEVVYDELKSFCENNLKKNPEDYNEYHALLVEHAKRSCRTKPLCDDCILKSICKKNM